MDFKEVDIKIIADSIPTKFFNFKFDVPKDEFGNPDYDINWYEKSKGSIRDDMTTLSKKYDHKTFDDAILCLVFSYMKQILIPNLIP
jgi:hypothetical protein